MGDVLVRTISMEHYKEFSKNIILSLYLWKKVHYNIIFNPSNFSVEEVTDGLINEFLREKLPTSYKKNRNLNIYFKQELVF